MSRAIEQRAADSACMVGDARVVRDGARVALAYPRSRERATVAAVQCGSAAVARHAAELATRINVGDTPEARLRAAVIYASAAPVAAARRMRGGRP